MAALLGSSGRHGAGGLCCACGVWGGERGGESIGGPRKAGIIIGGPGVTGRRTGVDSRTPLLAPLHTTGGRPANTPGAPERGPSPRTTRAGVMHAARARLASHGVSLPLPLSSPLLRSSSCAASSARRAAINPGLARAPACPVRRSCLGRHPRNARRPFPRARVPARHHIALGKTTSPACLCGSENELWRGQQQSSSRAHSSKKAAVSGRRLRSNQGTAGKRKTNRTHRPLSTTASQKGWRGAAWSGPRRAPQEHAQKKKEAWKQGYAWPHSDGEGSPVDPTQTRTSASSLGLGRRSKWLDKSRGLEGVD